MHDREFFLNHNHAENRERQAIPIGAGKLPINFPVDWGRVLDGTMNTVDLDAFMLNWAQDVHDRNGVTSRLRESTPPNVEIA